MATVGDNAQSDVKSPTDQPAVEKDGLSSRAQDYTRKLKSSIKRQTESLPALEGQTAVSIDDVFTNVTIQRVQKDQEKTKLGKKQFDVFQASTTTLKKCSEMFIWPENDDPNSRTPNTTNPKCILLTGKAGIGKSEFCRKMSRDWSRDGILDFKFLFLLTYRPLSLLGHEELDLCDILNRSSLLDDQSIIDKGLLQYMIENPEKVLIIFDGYDEYQYRTEITGHLERKYPNDPHQKMPVPAVIAKIMKGKILNESVVMISSRPEEAQELLPEEVQELMEFPFDVRCEIKGFSPLQVQEYIKKYFKDNEKMKSAVLEHFKMNQILLSFGHIPVMCYLMCYYLKWHMTQSKTTENLPNTRSELYYEVIKVLIKRHSYTEMTETEVEEILHKLAELAIYLMREKKMIFTEEDMMKSFKFSEQELMNLKKSGLFDCCPGVKKSAFDKPPLEFVFSHLTMQEFLCALWFVEKKQLPEKEGTSEVIWIFMAGLLRRKNDEKLKDQLTEKIKPQGSEEISQAATSASDQQTVTLDVKEGFHDLSPLGVLLEVPPHAVTWPAKVTYRKLDPDYSPAPATDDETLVSYVIEFTPTSLQKPIIVTLKHCGPSKEEGYETLVKALKHGKIPKEWEQIEEIREDSSFAREHFKSGYIQVMVSQLTTLAVVSRVIRDSFKVTEAGCVVRSSVCDDVMLEFPVGAVDQTFNGTMKLYRIPDHTEVLDGINAFPCPLIVIDGFEGITFNLFVKIRLPHPYPAGYHSGDVRVLCMEAPHEWKDITDQVQCIEHESFLELEVKHFSKLWAWICQVNPLTVASSLYQYLFMSPKHVDFAVFGKKSRSNKSLKIALVCVPCILTEQCRRKMEDLEDQSRYTELAYNTSNKPMRPNDKAYIKVEGCYEKELQGEMFLELIENNVCRKELLLKKSKNRGALVIFFLERKDGDVQDNLCQIWIDEEEILSEDITVEAAFLPSERPSAASLPSEEGPSATSPPSEGPSAGFHDVTQGHKLHQNTDISFFTRNHEKALVRLQQVDKDTQEVKEQLGFGFKARKKGNRPIVVTSSSTLPEDIQVDEIVVDRFRSKSKKKKYKTDPQDQVIVESIHMPKQDGITFLIGKGGNEKEFFEMDYKRKIRERRLSAYAFEDKDIVELQFENKQGTWHFTSKSKEDFDVKKAKGAPIIYKDKSLFVIGLLSTNSSGQLYPLLFTKDFYVPGPLSDEPSQPMQ